MSDFCFFAVGVEVCGECMCFGDGDVVRDGGMVIVEEVDGDAGDVFVDVLRNGKAVWVDVGWELIFGEGEEGGWSGKLLEVCLDEVMFGCEGLDVGVVDGDAIVGYGLVV